MKPEVSSAAGSDDWMAIDQYGNLVAPGSEESLKLDFIKGDVYKRQPSFRSLGFLQGIL